MHWLLFNLAPIPIIFFGYSTEGQKWASNTTSVDIYIKKDKIQEVKQALNNASMDFRILVEDVQQAIDEENPPQKFEELNEFSTRKGEYSDFFL